MHANFASYFLIVAMITSTIGYYWFCSSFLFMHFCQTFLSLFPQSLYLYSSKHDNIKNSGERIVLLQTYCGPILTIAVLDYILEKYILYYMGYNDMKIGNTVKEREFFLGQRMNKTSNFVIFYRVATQQTVHATFSIPRLLHIQARLFTKSRSEPFQVRT